MATSEFYQPQDIAQWTVLVTGASSGFGYATAWRFAELGCKLVLVARRSERLSQLSAEICAKYNDAKVHCCPMDMQDLDKIEALPLSLPTEFSQVDILVNNAGLALGKSSADENVTADVVTMINTNLTSLVVATATFSKGMKARGRGHIINVGSVAGHEAYAGG